MKIDTTKTGLEMLFPDYGARLMDILINFKGEMDNREAHKEAKIYYAERDETISRATIIGFMDWATDQGFLTRRKETCRGGWKSIYKAATDRIGLWEMVLEKIVPKIQKDSYPGIFDQFHSNAE